MSVLQKDREIEPNAAADSGKHTAARFALVAIPILVGIAMAINWPDAGESFYSSVSQIIATLFIAIAVEFFYTTARMEILDVVRVVLLTALSWLGLIACVRALAGDQNSVTVGLAGAGVTAASVLVSLALYEQVTRHQTQDTRAGRMASALIFCFVIIPVALLMWR